MALLYVALGFVSLLLQIVVIRELLTGFSGNELDIGITLAIWLLSVGTGSLAGSRLRGGRAFGGSFLAVAALALPTLLAIRLIRPALGLELGEGASLGATFLSTALCLFPLCFALGAQFPLAVAHRAGRLPEEALPGGRAAPAVYGLEALGAFLGGLVFTFLVSGRMGPGTLVLALSLLYCLIALALPGGRKPLLFALVPLALYLAVIHLEGAFFRGGQILKRVESRYGEILLARLDGQMNLYSAGQFVFSHPDPPNEELRVHLPMTVHPAPRRVLAIGGSPAKLREFVKYDIERVDYVQMDPKLMEVALDMLGGERDAVRDERVRVIVRDGRGYIKGLEKPLYDLVVLDLPSPSTASINRFYTVEFFGEVRAVLREGGIVSITVPTSAGYVSRRMRLANGSVFRSLKAVFPHVEASTEEYGYLFASGSPLTVEPGVLEERFRQRGVQTADFHPYVFEDAFMPYRVELQRRRLDGVDVLNTDFRPAAYLYNLMLWAEIHGGGALNLVLEMGGYNAVILLVLFAAATAGVIRMKRRTLYCSIFTTGYAAMAFTVAVMLAFQAAYGYVFEMFGLLSALFMLGVAGGAYLLRRATIRLLTALELLMAVLAASATVFFKAEPLFYLFSLLAGAMTGCAFAAVNILARTGEPSRAGGMFYALDLGGSFLGATLTAIIFVPLLGIRLSLFIAGGLKLMSALMVSLVRHE